MLCFGYLIINQLLTIPTTKIGASCESAKEKMLRDVKISENLLLLRQLFYHEIFPAILFATGEGGDGAEDGVVAI